MLNALRLNRAPEIIDLLLPALVPSMPGVKPPLAGDSLLAVTKPARFAGKESLPAFATSIARPIFFAGTDSPLALLKFCGCRICVDLFERTESSFRKVEVPLSSLWEVRESTPILDQALEMQTPMPSESFDSAKPISPKRLLPLPTSARENISRAPVAWRN